MGVSGLIGTTLLSLTSPSGTSSVSLITGLEREESKALLPSLVKMENGTTVSPSRNDPSPVCAKNELANSLRILPNPMIVKPTTPKTMQISTRLAFRTFVVNNHQQVIPSIGLFLYS